ncbi:TIGR02285 family protein [Pseudomonas sp. CFBP 13719]|uniref:TIGR02285 family protein n=1 Tax=Pseudomonas sp. CFBP 13719 TaxID=2775303 RepID=UPI0017804A02|nr:TIGR02285 family protein [Pseudomonas sp. CFBP 13719]MBD8684619.1 TIGR02285 family protein [Pseudomonas sp. CFBP 13719]
MDSCCRILPTSSLLLALALCSCLLNSPLAHGRETITWLLRDLAPLTIASGPGRNQGAIDQALPLLRAALPDYDHNVLRVNRARASQMLGEPGLNCDPALLWTAERARSILYSVPSMNVLSNTLIMQPGDLPFIAGFMQDGKVDLSALLRSRTVALGIIAERSYGPVVDRILAETDSYQLLAHHGNEAMGSLLRMERLGRIKALIGYWQEARYQARQEGLDPEQLVQVPIEGAARSQFIHVGCSDSPASHRVLAALNSVLLDLRSSQLAEFYAQWLTPAERPAYLRETTALFNAHRNEAMSSQR